MKSDNLDIINSLYKPHKYTLKGKAIILNCDDGDIVIKKKNPLLYNRYHYLKSRGFDNYVPIIDSSRSNYDVFPFLIEDNIPDQQKANDLSRVAAILHAKTSYNKEIDSNLYDEIYNSILENCDYLIESYSKLYDELFPIKYHKPHEILFIDNYSKINNVLLFCKGEAQKWYNLVSDKKNQRVSLIHNDLKLDHFLKSDNDYLISFDKSKFDTPVLDMVKFYKKEWSHINFAEVLQNYLYHFNYTEDELKLFFILISLHEEINFDNDNFSDVIKVSNLCNYINKTEELVRPYYSKDKEEE